VAKNAIKLKTNVSTVTPMIVDAIDLLKKNLPLKMDFRIDSIFELIFSPR
jgi:hypothetical protein